jgi:hypothetical protein
VKKLIAHPAFDLKNPNRARALLHAFALYNPASSTRPTAPDTASSPGRSWPWIA